MDQHTLNLIVQTGRMDRDRVTAKPTHRHCTTCRRIVLVALADDGAHVAGIRTTLDPRPLTPLGELQALTTGHLTFGHVGSALTWRCRLRIRTSPAGSSYDVHHTHKCEPAPGIEYAPPEKRRAFIAPHYDTCPF